MDRKSFDKYRDIHQVRYIRRLMWTGRIGAPLNALLCAGCASYWAWTAVSIYFAAITTASLFFSYRFWRMKAL